jgi:trk/ktr system potassium uptake protein
MRVLIVGAGEVGFHLAERLSQENHDVVVIEPDAERAEIIQDHLDVMTVVGNGAALPVLERAGVRDARILMAVTSKDEVNLISSLAATRMGVPFTIARISNPEYYGSGSALSKEMLGIELMINPERECAWETFNLLSSPAATDVASFAEGRVQLIGMVVREGAPVAGRTLAELGAALPDRHFLTAAIVRDGVTEIPHGSSTIEVGDLIYLVAPTSEVSEVPPLVGCESYKLQRIMIAGGSAEGAYLAEIMGRHNVETTIIDRSRTRCLELAERLPKALVLHGDATDLELLEVEGVAGMDGYLASTGSDDTNILSSLLAQQAGARKVISLISELELLPLGMKVGIDATVSPRLSTVNAILRYVRHGRVSSVAAMKGIDAEAITFEVAEGAAVAGKALHEVDLPEGAVVMTISREDEVIIPRGNDRIEIGDHVVVFVLLKALAEVEQAFEG